MKTGVHPEVYDKAKTTCTNCGAIFLIPSTIAEQSVETCRMCHPIYTGKKQTDLKGSRIERFRKRLTAVKK